MTTRRHFIWLLPASGAALLSACSESAPPPSAAPPAAAPASSAEYPVPAPAPAPEVAQTPAATGPMLEASDPTAAALGYVAVAANADKAKYPNFVEGSACSNCTLYQGAIGSEAGPCPLFPGKQVAAAGWCASYVKKAT
ncbi:high-potential iron-sulfur protein [Hydrogenophaga sp.]|uniref:high-potential iron-sulfur protein n=1 Tax=Hydrogenophaga sp. TaxID=1904254 RepID=UPI00272FC5CC|nr:high-potential iron-sulfur protein [Hydrogenophaga sp.]MDP2015908.1 high-potential iron-sulfur protein [Hydrogenophaga sp.]